MKKIFFFTIALASLFMVSCTKTTPTPPAVTNTNPNPIVGLWVGTYQINDAGYLGDFYYSFSLFSDSTLVQQGGGSNGQVWTGKGTWSLAGDSVWTALISNADVSQGSLTQRITARYDSTAGTLSHGTWVYLTGGTQSGTFSLKRVK